MDVVSGISAAGSWFINLFQLGGNQFTSWVTSISPLIVVLLVFMNSLVAFIGKERVNKFAVHAGGNPVTRYFVLPFISAIILCNPMALSMGKFLPEFYKPAYYAAASYHCHTNSGIFAHINPQEIFIYLGIASGITALGLDTSQLAVRYMLVGFVANFISGWSTEFTTKIVEQQMHVRLARTFDEHNVHTDTIGDGVEAA